MKNLFISLAVAALFSMVACGPSAKQLEEQRIADSIKVADSLAVVDSINQAIEQAKQDSIAKAIADSIAADSIAKAGKKGKK
jgi:sensor histidine kinase regulating citrate/malate metabolism